MAVLSRRRDEATTRRFRCSLAILGIIVFACVSLWQHHDEIGEGDGLQNEEASQQQQQQQQQGGQQKHRKVLLQDKNAIVTSVRLSKQVLEDLCRALGSLSRLHDNNRTPVLVFADTSATLAQPVQAYLRSCTPRQLEFPPESSSGVLFWISKIFTLESLSSYDTIMRLDAGACWQEESDLVYLPGLPNTTIVYQALTDRKVNVDACGSLVEFAKEYIVRNHVIVQSPHLWYEIDKIWRERMKCPAYQTNFEVVRLEMMRQESVQLWLSAATLKNPKWSEELLRSFTVAMFASGVIPPSKAYPKGYTFSVGRPGVSCRNLPGASLQTKI